MTIYKYCANGNDFLIFHTFAARDYSQLARRLCHRHSGIGADGLVVVLPYAPSPTLFASPTPPTPLAPLNPPKTTESRAKACLDSRLDSRPESSPEFCPESSAESSDTPSHIPPPIAYRWDFYNADGSRANMCGNASRCVAHYAYCMGLAPAQHAFLTSMGHDVIKVQIQSCLDSGIEPRPDSRAIVASDLGCYRHLRALDLDSGDCDTACGMAVPESLRGLLWHYIDTGVPHVVGFVPDRGILDRLAARDSSMGAEIAGFMRALRQHHNANVNLAYAKRPDLIHLATYERGVEDITLACGTGMAAVLLVGHIMLGLDSAAKLIPPSGEILQLWCERIEPESSVDSHVDSGQKSRRDSRGNVALDSEAAASAYPAMRVVLQGEVELVAVCQVGLASHL